MNLWSLVKQYIIRNIIDIYSIYSIKSRGPLCEDGWFRSFREQASVDAKGEPLPWFTYPAIEFISKRINIEMSVFEYGCGGSTLWWAKRLNEVISIEHDRDWYEKVVNDVPLNVKLYQIDLTYGGAYSRKVMEYEKRFDVVVVDGRDRVNCVKNSLKALKNTGVIIFDNSDRKEYSEGVSFLLENRFNKIEFVGLCPIVNCKSETSIFYRTGNSFGI